MHNAKDDLFVNALQWLFDTVKSPHIQLPYDWRKCCIVVEYQCHITAFTASCFIKLYFKSSHLKKEI